MFQAKSNYAIYSLVAIVFASVGYAQQPFNSQPVRQTTQPFTPQFDPQPLDGFRPAPQPFDNQAVGGVMRPTPRFNAQPVGALRALAQPIRAGGYRQTPPPFDDRGSFNGPNARTAEPVAPTIQPTDGVLILANGEVLSGQISQNGDRYIVSLGEGGELRIPTKQVEMHCRNLEEAYLRKKAKMGQAGADAHLDLADWCLRQSLLSRAADELLTGMSKEPNNRRIVNLERRLQLAVQQPALNSNRPTIHKTSVSLRELERTMRSLPPGAVEQFTDHVQPLILNRCAASGCHGSGAKNGFRLIRPSWGRTVARRFTQRNLYASLQQIHREEPDSSPLLTLTSEPHGGLANAVFGKQELEQYQVLADWVRRVTAADSKKSLEKMPLIASHVLQATYTEPVNEKGSKKSAAKKTSRQQSTQSSVPVPDGYVPRDPFDPEIFNRNFLTKSESDQ